MTKKTRELLESILSLKATDRAEIADVVVASLDRVEEANDPSETVDQAWGREISRRLREELAKGDQGVPLSDVIARLK